MDQLAVAASSRAWGTLFIHACTRALTAPLEWALSDVLSEQVSLDWSAQPIAPAMVRAELDWSGADGSAARMVSALRQLPHLRFEVTEHRLDGAERFSFTPTLGVFRADLDSLGNLLVGEQRLRALSERLAAGVDVAAELDAWLGTAWDAELEPFRVASDGESVRWLHRVG